MITKYFIKFRYFKLKLHSSTHLSEVINSSKNISNLIVKNKYEGLGMNDLLFLLIILLTLE